MNIRSSSSESWYLTLSSASCSFSSAAALSFCTFAYPPVASTASRVSFRTCRASGPQPATTNAITIAARDIVVFIGYLQGFYWKFGSLVRVHNTYNRALSALARIFELLDEKPDVVDAPDATELPPAEGRVALEDVSFKYATGEMVLEDVSVVAEPGDTVALVGRSGAGKTSLVNLIPRFYDPIEGRILIDGTDLCTVTQESLRRNIAMVLQDTFLFNGTVKENVRCFSSAGAMGSSRSSSPSVCANRTAS